MRRIDKGAVAPGDVIVIRFDADPQHLSIVADYAHGGLSMIHALDRPGHERGKVLEHRLPPHYVRRIVAAYALPGVAA